MHLKVDFIVGSFREFGKIPARNKIGNEAIAAMTMPFEGTAYFPPHPPRYSRLQELTEFLSFPYEDAREME